MTNEEKVLDALNKGKALKSAEIAAATEIDPKEVGKIVAKLKKEEKVFSPKVCFYEAVK